MTVVRRAAALLGLGVAAGLGLALVSPAAPAAAHPLGNFSVNQLDALTLYPDRVEVAVTVDVAELPTLQERSTVDASGEGVVDGDERAAYATRQCADYARRFAGSVAGKRLEWTVGRTGFEYAEGAAGLLTSRLTCRLSAPADLRAPAVVRVDNSYRTDRVGWREVTATGQGVRLVDPPVPAESRSRGDLRGYPQELLSSPPDVRSAELKVEPVAARAEVPGMGAAGGSGSPAGAGAAPIRRPPTAQGLVGKAEQRLTDFVTARGQSPLIGVLAVLLALALGAAHAALPGHGKTVMAAYLAGKRGRARDAVAVGAVVTLTHTGGVLVVGLLLTTVASLAGQTLLGWLGVASGVLIVAVGLGMLSQVRRGRRHDHHHHLHHDGHHGHDHGHRHDGRDDHGHDHDHGHGHHHSRHRRPSRLGIAGIGIAGGLVPSPSALIVLLGAVGLGRTVFGVLLVVAYGLGMAATLTAAGLLLVGLSRRLRRRAPLIGRWRGLVARLSAAAPAATGALVLLVGIGLVGRAAAGLA